MEALLPTEIARLVYGYLVDEECHEAALKFLECSKNMQECLTVFRKGRPFHTRVLGRTLIDIIDMLSEVTCLVKAFSDGGNNDSEQIVHKLLQLLGFSEQDAAIVPKRSNTVFLSISVPSQDSPAKPGEPFQKPTKKSSGEQPKLPESPRQPNPNQPEPPDPDSFLNSLLDNRTLHEKLAENINKALCSEKKVDKGRTPERIVETVLHNTEEDPIFEELICSLIGPRVQESSTPEDTEAEVGEGAGGKVIDEVASRVEEQNDAAVRGILAIAPSSANETPVGQSGQSEPSSQPPQEHQPSTNLVELAMQDCIFPEKETPSGVSNPELSSNASHSPASSQPQVVGSPACVPSVPSPLHSLQLIPIISTPLQNQSLKLMATEHDSFIISNETLSEPVKHRPIRPKPITAEELTPISEMISRGGVRTRGGTRRRGGGEVAKIRKLVPNIRQVEEDRIEVEMIEEADQISQRRPVRNCTRKLKENQQKTPSRRGGKAKRTNTRSKTTPKSAETSVENVKVPATIHDIPTGTHTLIIEGSSIVTEVSAVELASYEVVAQADNVSESLPVIPSNDESQPTTKKDPNQTSLPALPVILTESPVKESAGEPHKPSPHSNEKETPEQNLNLKERLKKRKSMSTPRRSHVRVLQFRTPTKTGPSMRRANTSPKNTISPKSRLAQLRSLKNLRRGSLFRSPKKEPSKKTGRTWDSDLRGFGSSTKPWIEEGLSKISSPVTKKSHEKSPKKNCGSAEKSLEGLTSEDIAKRIERDVLDAIGDVSTSLTCQSITREDGDSRIVAENVESRSQTVGDLANLLKTPAKLDFVGLIPSTPVTPATAAASEQLMKNLLTPRSPTPGACDKETPLTKILNESRAFDGKHLLTPVPPTPRPPSCSPRRSSPRHPSISPINASLLHSPGASLTSTLIKECQRIEAEQVPQNPTPLPVEPSISLVAPSSAAAGDNNTRADEKKVVPPTKPEAQTKKPRGDKKLAAKPPVVKLQNKVPSKTNNNPSQSTAQILNNRKRNQHSQAKEPRLILPDTSDSDEPEDNDPMSLSNHNAGKSSDKSLSSAKKTSGPKTKSKQFIKTSGPKTKSKQFIESSSSSSSSSSSENENTSPVGRKKVNTPDQKIMQKKSPLDSPRALKTKQNQIGLNVSSDSTSDDSNSPPVKPNSPRNPSKTPIKKGKSSSKTKSVTPTQPPVIKTSPLLAPVSPKAKIKTSPEDVRDELTKKCLALVANDVFNTSNPAITLPKSPWNPKPTKRKKAAAAAAAAPSKTKVKVPSFKELMQRLNKKPSSSSSDDEPIPGNPTVEMFPVSKSPASSEPSVAKSTTIDNLQLVFQLDGQNSERKVVLQPSSLINLLECTGGKVTLKNFTKFHPIVKSSKTSAKVQSKGKTESERKTTDSSRSCDKDKTNPNDSLDDRHRPQQSVSSTKSHPTPESPSRSKTYHSTRIPESIEDDRSNRSLNDRTTENRGSRSNTKKYSSRDDKNVSSSPNKEWSSRKRRRKEDDDLPYERRDKKPNRGDGRRYDSKDSRSYRPKDEFRHRSSWGGSRDYKRSERDSGSRPMDDDRRRHDRRPPSPAGPRSWRGQRSDPRSNVGVPPTLSSILKRKFVGEKEEGEVSDSDSNAPQPSSMNASTSRTSSRDTNSKSLEDKRTNLLERVGLDRFLSIVHGHEK